MNDGLSAADIMALTRNSDSNGGGGYGGNGAWDNPFIYLVWLALLGGGGLWGNRGGFGGGGSGGSGSGGCIPSCSDLFEGFNKQDVNGQLRGLTNGLSDGFYAINTGLLTGFNGIQRDLCSGFNSVNSGLASLGYQLGQCCCGIEKGIMNSDFHAQAGFNSLGTQMAQCCCDTKTLIQGTARDIIDSQNCNTRAILDFLTQDKIATLTAENQSLRFAASQNAQNAFITANQEAQTAELIRRLGRDNPVPAYVVPNPNCCYGNWTGFSGNGGCGCGCGSY